jgi:hypothetical protein
VRYLACVISKLVPVGRTRVEVPGMPALNLDVMSNQRMAGSNRQMAPRVSGMLQYFAKTIGEAPYPGFTLTAVDDNLPGGHSPAFFAIFHQPLPTSPYSWSDDPVAFDDIYKHLFLAHEVAHQWWGQAIGWKNYHEQWLSEGFAQYFAALYAQRAHGDEAFVTMLRQFRRWSLSESDEGPIDLGYRLGLIRGQGRIFRALVYNKGAAVLHMLRRLVGDEAFFDGLRRFYTDRKFQKAGTEDVERAMEEASGQPLDRFFARWIHGATLPTVRYSAAIRATEVVVQFDQDAHEVFDVPVTVTLQYADGRTQDVVVAVTAAHIEARLPTTGAVRSVQINRDSAAIARFVEP